MNNCSHRAHVAYVVLSSGTFVPVRPFWGRPSRPVFGSGADMEATMNGLIYLVGLVVVVLFILSVLGLR
jgi:hypothetical protein